MLCGRSPFPGKNKEEIAKMTISREIDLDKKESFNNISQECKNFIMCAMERDTSKRFSAEQLLQHPWIIKMSDQADQIIDESEKIEMIQNLKDFGNASKF